MYLSWQEKIITDFSDTNINALYNDGFLFTRIGHGVMKQTRSLRINLAQFVLSSENRRVLKKNETLKLSVSPLPYREYHWKIGKLAKDFYETKFGPKTFGANKVKELLTDPQKSNFNLLLVYKLKNDVVGYCIVRTTDELIHYSYPFYKLPAYAKAMAGKQATSYQLPANIGLGMMTQAVVWAKEQGKKYIYLGSASRPTDTYKLQFSGLEWWDGQKWEENISNLKHILHETASI